MVFLWRSKSSLFLLICYGIKVMMIVDLVPHVFIQNSCSLWCVAATKIPMQDKVGQGVIQSNVYDDYDDLDKKEEEIKVAKSGDIKTEPKDGKSDANSANSNTTDPLTPHTTTTVVSEKVIPPSSTPSPPLVTKGSFFSFLYTEKGTLDLTTLVVCLSICLLLIFGVIVLMMWTCGSFLITVDDNGGGNNRKSKRSRQIAFI